MVLLAWVEEHFVGGSNNKQSMIRKVKVTRDSNLMPSLILRACLPTQHDATYSSVFECSGHDLLFVTLAINSLYFYP